MVSEGEVWETLYRSGDLDPEILRFYGVDPEKVVKRAIEVLRRMGRNRIEKFGKKEAILTVLKGVFHGIAYTRFLKDILDKKKGEGKGVLFIGIGRDAIPFVMAVGGLRNKGENVGAGFIGISSKNIELVRDLVGVIGREPRPDALIRLKRRLGKILEKYREIAEKRNMVIVFLDVGINGTHVRPLKLLVDGAETAIFHTIPQNLDKFDHVGHRLPEENIWRFIAATEHIPHSTGSFVEVNRPEGIGNPGLHKVYEKAFWAGMNHALEELYPPPQARHHRAG